MGRYLRARLCGLIFVLFGITFLSFAMMHLAGSDTATELYSNTGTAVSQETIDAARARLGLDRPLLVQYFSWLGGMMTGDMGVSYVSGQDVFATFLSKLPATLLLAATSILLTIAISIPLGVASAVAHKKARTMHTVPHRILCSLTDSMIRCASFVGNSLPNFFVALLLIHFFAIRWGWLPVISAGLTFKGAILPTLTLTIAMSAKYLRQVRAAVLDELSKDYVAGAKARGVPETTILMKSVLRSSLTTILTLLTLSVGSLLGGTAIVETIFLWDGVGKLAVDAILMRDYPLIQAYVVWMAIIYVGVNLITDLLYLALDPRVRLGVNHDGT
ncbi:MAG: ABC transporter permease [Schwartzia sp.]|nr:ABC transporter permease [Schwartzia sp. (in: firmicutes)]